jgi:hypothetical protein
LSQRGGVDGAHTANANPASLSLPPSPAVVGADGSFFKAAYDPEKPGEATRVAYAQFVKGGDL